MSTKALKTIAKRLKVVPSREAMDSALATIGPARLATMFADTPIVQHDEEGRAYVVDADQLAPLLAEKLRFTYAKLQEIKWPELKAANGDVLPIDTSPPPSADDWRYYVVEQTGYADWIDDDGSVMPGSSVKLRPESGKLFEAGHGYTLTVFDLERAAAADLPLPSMKQKFAREAHDRFANWVWLFGDLGKELLGLITHPNIQNVRAPADGSASSRAWADKSNDLIMRDVALLIRPIANVTKGRYHAAKVFMPRSLMQICVDRRLGDGDGFASLWDLIKSRYAGDDSGQGKVEFHVLNECAADERTDPRTGTDTSGVDGDFMIAIGDMDTDEAAFVRARPFTQRPPQEVDFKMKHMTHSKVGGCKLQHPQAVVRLDFADPA